MESLLDQNLKVPIALREWVYRSCQWSPIRKIGMAYYEFAALKVALQLKEIFPFAEILWFGGSLHRCEPGISDLDFVVVQKSLGVCESDLYKVREALRRFRKLCLPVGEIHITPSNLWKLLENSTAGASYWFRKQKVLVGEEFFERETWSCRNTLSESLIGLSLFHWYKAQLALVSMRNGDRVFHLASFRREITKALDYSQRCLTQGFRKGEPAALFAELAESLRDLAEERRAEPSEMVREFEVDWGGGQGVRFVTEVVNRRWESLMRKSGVLSRCQSTTIPRFFVLQDSSNSFLDFYDDYIKFLRFAPFESFEAPLVVPPAVYSVYLSGWSWGPLFEHKDWVPLHLTQDEEWLHRFQCGTFLRLWERLLVEAVTLQGKVFSKQSYVWGNALKEICTLAMSLRNRKLSLELPWSTPDDSLQAVRKVYERGESLGWVFPATGTDWDCVQKALDEISLLLHAERSITGSLH